MSGQLVVAVDGGGTKTDAVAVALDGTVVSRRRGPGSSPHFEGLDRSVAVVEDLVRAVSGGGGIHSVDLYLSGLDLAAELDEYRGALDDRAWATDAVVDNDLFALLRAGTDEPDAVAVVCGSGVNAVGVRADGETVRFPSLGGLSGDWGGGYGLGSEALWHAARDVDGRGPQTSLTTSICRTLGVASVSELIEQLHFGRRPSADLIMLAPDVFADAAAGDRVAGDLVDRQADEVVAFVAAIVRRLGFAEAAIPVVLGGSILQAGHRRLDDRITAAIARIAPRARIARPTEAPIVGAALLALQRAGGSASALERCRAELSRVTVLEAV